MSPRLVTCPALSCRREVEELYEVIFPEGESVVKVLRCDDCMRVIDLMIPQMHTPGNS